MAGEGTDWNMVAQLVIFTLSNLMSVTATSMHSSLSPGCHYLHLCHSLSITLPSLTKPFSTPYSSFAQHSVLILHPHSNPSLSTSLLTPHLTPHFTPHPHSPTHPSLPTSPFIPQLTAHSSTPPLTCCTARVLSMSLNS